MFKIKKAVVTGGSSGIGKELVNLLLQDGCEVFSLSRTVHPRESFNNQGTLHQIACDITDEKSLNNAFLQIGELTDSFDVLFSNAGFGISGPISDTPKEQVVRMFDVHVFAAMETVRRSIPFLARSKGRIILTSSIAAVVSLPYQSFYSAVKSSLNMLALALNTELKHDGIRAVAIMPGDTATAFTAMREKVTCESIHVSERYHRSIARMERDEQTGASAETVARKILRIVRKRAPKPLYGIGFFYRLVLVLFKILPVRLTNWATGLLYG